MKKTTIPIEDVIARLKAINPAIKLESNIEMRDSMEYRIGFPVKDSSNSRTVAADPSTKSLKAELSAIGISDNRSRMVVTNTDSDGLGGRIIFEIPYAMNESKRKPIPTFEAFEKSQKVNEGSIKDELQKIVSGLTDSNFNEIKGKVQDVISKGNYMHHDSGATLGPTTRSWNWYVNNNDKSDKIKVTTTITQSGRVSISIF